MGQINTSLASELKDENENTLIRSEIGNLRRIVGILIERSNEMYGHSHRIAPATHNTYASIVKSSSTTSQQKPHLNTTPEALLAMKTQNPASPYMHQYKNTTFAEAHAKSVIHSDTLRNLVVHGTPEQQLNIQEQLKKDNCCADLGILSIEKRGRNGYHIRCNDAQTAKLFSDKIQHKYGDAISVNTVKVASPRVKVVGLRLPGNLNNKEINEKLLTQNEWLHNAQFEVTEQYEIKTSKTSYVNITLKCDIKTQRAILDRGSIIFGLSACRVYELVQTIQCFRCQRYGHISRECTHQVRCKHCTEQHESHKCTKSNELPVCANCMDANKTGEHYKIHHRATDHSCQSRAQRIDAIKTLLLERV